MNDEKQNEKICVDFEKRFNLTTEDLAVYYKILCREYRNFKYIDHVVFGNCLVMHIWNSNLTVHPINEVIIIHIEEIKQKIDRYKKEEKEHFEKNKISEIAELKAKARLI